MDSIGEGSENSIGLLLIDACGERIVAGGALLAEDLDDEFWGFSWPEDNFGESAAVASEQIDVGAGGTGS